MKSRTLQLMEKDIKDISTEERIKNAALKLFIKKGFDGTKTRDIAEAAGINISLMHYYYRSKDKLFEIVIKDTLSKFSSIMDKIFESGMPLHQKIKAFVIEYTEFLKTNPLIPLFILSEAHSNADKLEKMMHTEKTLSNLKFELKKLAEEGIIRPIHHGHFMANIVSLTMFPFISKPIMIRKTGISAHEVDQLLEERKEMIPEMIINHLYIEKPI